ncbi:2-dehydropantoate 2-reductase [Hyaloraphidium curvatum]|nr:2-dehydropantoate 2-reductase [Hyaloraphidium curvatum]
MTRVCIVGTGAIGSFVAAKLALTAVNPPTVTVVARGANLEAIRSGGISLLDHDGVEIGRARNVVAVESTKEAGPQDVVVLAVKAHQVGDVADSLANLYTDNTVVVTMQNGIPFWYFRNLSARPDLASTAIRTVDPDGTLADRVQVERIIGCVVYPATDRPAPGFVRHIEGDRFPVGELDGRLTPRVRMVSDLLQAAGLKAPVFHHDSDKAGTKDIRDEIWLKLWGNLSFNPISALTHATLVDLCTFPLTRELAAAMMREAQGVAESLGAHFRVTLEKRIAGGAAVGKHKTSTLQDVEVGNDPEVDALVGAVAELGTVAGLPTPHIDAVFACVKLLAKVMAEEKSACRMVPVVVQ